MELKNAEEKVDILISKMANPALLKILSNLYNLKKEKGILSVGECNVAGAQKTNSLSFNETNECLKILSFSDIKSCIGENSDALGFSEKRFNSNFNSTSENVSVLSNFKPGFESVSSSDSDVCVLDELPKPKKQKCYSKTKNKFSFEPTPSCSTDLFTDSDNSKDCSLQLASKPWTGICKKMLKGTRRKRKKSFKGISKKKHSAKFLSKDKNSELEVDPNIIIIKSDIDSDVAVTQEFNMKHNDSKVSTDVTVAEEFNAKRNDLKISSDVAVTEEFNTKHNDSKISSDVAVTEFKVKNNDLEVSSDIDSDVAVTEDTKHNVSKVSSDIVHDVALTEEFNSKHIDSKANSDFDSDVVVTEEFNSKHIDSKDSKVNSDVAVTEEFFTKHNDSKVSKDVTVTVEFNTKYNDSKVSNIDSDVVEKEEFNTKNYDSKVSDIDSDVAVTEEFNPKHNDSKVSCYIDSDVSVTEEFNTKYDDSKVSNDVTVTEEFRTEHDGLTVSSDIDSDVTVTEEFSTKHNDSKVSASGYAECSNTLNKQNCKIASKQNKLYSTPLGKIKSSKQNHHLVFDQNIYTISSDSSEESDQSDSIGKDFKCNARDALPTSIKVTEALESTCREKARNNFKTKEMFNIVKTNSLMKDINLYSTVDREKNQGNPYNYFIGPRTNKNSFKTGNSTQNFNEIRKSYDKILNQLRSVANCNKILTKLSIANPGLISLKSVVSDNNLQYKDFEFVPEPVNFKIPRLHECEVVGQISKEEELKMIEEGIFIRHGSFTSREDEILKDNFLEFVKQYGITNPMCLLGIDSDLRRDRDLLQFIRTKHFYLRLGRNLNDRTLNSIYRRARKLLM